MAAYFVVGVVDDEEDRLLPKPRVFRDRTRVLDTLDDQSLLRRYRMPRHAILELLGIVSHRLENPTQRSHSLSPETKLLIALRFYSKGLFFSELGDLHGVVPSSVSRVLEVVNSAICTEFNVITFPKTVASQRRTKEAFHGIAGFSKVLGCIDGTLISIIRPTSNEEVAYVCRKGFHAINLQAICDADLRFTSVVCKWPGSVHDSFMRQNSTIGRYFEDSNMDGWLLGDSGYACRPWLLTPVGHPSTRPEERFNTAHCRTRKPVERAFGLMKSRFRCLHKSTGCLPFKPDKCHKVAYAVCQLHNFCINLRLPPPPLEDAEQDQQDNQYQGPVRDGFTTRRALINQSFM